MVELQPAEILPPRSSCYGQWYNEFHIINGGPIEGTIHGDFPAGWSSSLWALAIMVTFRAFGLGLRLQISTSMLCMFAGGSVCGFLDI